MVRAARGRRTVPARGRAAAVLVVVELAQGLIGFVQYFTHLPIVLVGTHMLGACLVWTGIVAVLLAIRDRPAPPQVSTASPPASLPANDPVPSR